MSKDKLKKVASELEKASKMHTDQAKKIKEAMVNEVKPERTKCFLCDGMCPHATFCFDDD